MDDPQQQIHSALRALRQHEDIDRVRVSHLYESLPMGDVPQPNYINAVCEFITTLLPMSLLDLLQSIELELGRHRDPSRGYQHWGPRPIDLDLLLYNELELDSDRLTLPHSGIANRSFVLQPLYDLAPNLSVPGHGHISDLLINCETYGIRRLE